MKIQIKTLLTALLFIALLANSAKSQIAISNPSEIAKIKSGITYIAMKDPASGEVEEYIDALKTYWTFNQFKVIKYTEIDKYAAPGNSYFTIGGYETIVASGTNMNYSNTHLYLELWTPSEKYFQKRKGKKLEFQDKVQIGRIELFTDFETLMKPSNIYLTDYNSTEHIRNWGPGIFSNYIQQLMTLLDKGEEHSLYAKVYNDKALKELKKEVLYVPDYVLIKFNKFNGDESKKHEEQEIMEDYKFKYKLLTTSELNEKIMTEETPFYYLAYVKSSTDKYVSVINSKTGEMIYTTYSPVSYNISSKDFKELVGKIE